MYRTGRLAAQSGFFALFGIAGLILGIVDVSGDPPEGRGIITIVLAPLLLGMSTLFAIRMRIRARSGDSARLEWVEATRESGVVIPYSRGVWGSFCVMTFAMVCFYGLVALAGWVLVAAQPSDSAVLVMALVVTLAVLYLLWFVVDGFRGKLARGSVTLTPSGVYHRSWAFTSFFDWNNIQSVAASQIRQLPVITAEYRAYYDRRPHMTRCSRVWKQPEWKAGPDLFVIGTYLSVDPVLVYQALKYYVAHPEQRAELASEAGVERLRSASVVDS